MKFLKGVGKFIAIILCIVLLVVEIAVHLVFGSAKLVSKSNVSSVLSNYTIKDFLALTSDGDVDIQTQIKELSSENGITEEQVEAILNSSECIEILGEIVGSFSESLITGDRSKFIDNQEFDKIVTRAADALYNVSGIQLTAGDKEKVIDMLVTELDPVYDSLEEALGESNDVFDITKFVFSSTTKLLLIGAVVVITLLICFFWWSFKTGIKISAIITGIVGGIIAILSILINYAFDYISIAFDPIKENQELLSPFVSNIKTTLLINGIISLVVGIAIAVGISILFKKKEKKLETPEVTATV